MAVRDLLQKDALERFYLVVKITVGVALLFALFQYSTSENYTLMNSEEKGLMRINQRTGKAEFLYGSKTWVSIDSTATYEDITY